ncbi:MAG: hypothetical protein Q4D96_13340, partial [Propionibacteriaceae bacterium]|nr:hypothetical protein [Propionibacteriaceae bacterium]
MQKRILVSIAALAVTSAVAAAAVNTSIGSNVTEPVAEPAVRTAPSVAAASPERSASEEPESEPTVVAELPQAPSDAAPTPEEQQSSTAAEEATAAGAATPEEAASSEAAGAGASPSQASPAARTSSAKAERETANRASRAQDAAQRENVAGGGGQDRSAAEIPGWRMDYFEGFEGAIEDTGWERYGWGNPKVGQGAMGVRTLENTFTSGGELLVRTKYENGEWSAGGASTKQVFTASRGRWEVRARMPQAKGIGYVFLLWPKDEGWPPEIDFAEGRVNGPEVMGVYHWDPDNKQEHRFFD